MYTPSYRTSSPDRWTLPRPYSDASQRFMKFGAVQPMHEPTLWQKLFRAS
ncbi:hypothetical protein [Croceicoccus marinus]|jgi:hypothetical protein|uniref:Uncharacterized protein n=1 Tax=Croceicoccus marinus TaxID=450378 RepID=A0A7G6VSC9_9SPHN|nr:hypothetical protein [Croceicoccus marinus]QNE04644.1 hypothetical protein H4O24_11845 [Croceicoccus marinus]